jgi:hypothetical protein
LLAARRWQLAPTFRQFLAVLPVAALVSPAYPITCPGALKAAPVAALPTLQRLALAAAVVSMAAAAAEAVRD